MIITEFYDGQGLGNQLWLYAITRAKALELGVDFGIQSPEKFKGFNLFDLDLGTQVLGGKGPEGGPPEELPQGINNYFRENLVRHPLTGEDITDYSQEWNSIKESTKIDGNFQGENYLIHHKSDISNWLAVNNIEEYEKPDENVCIINFRGGEYVGMKSVFLPKKYWADARKRMLEINPKMQFKVVTDDPDTASLFFPDTEIKRQSMEQDYVDVYTAKYLIIANTSFAWFPSWLNTNLIYAIAPKYWWGFNNNNYWVCGYALTRGLNYLDKSGKYFTYEECLAELDHVEHKLSLNNNSKLIRFSATSPIRVELKQRLRNVAKTHIPRILIDRILCVQVGLNRRILSFKKEKIDYFSLLRPKISNQLKKNAGNVYDCVYFFNELSLLEIRLEILDPFVDYFVIFESDRTFTGLKKGSIYKANEERFAKFSHKIIHFYLEDCPKDRDQIRSMLYSTNKNSRMKDIARLSLTSKNVPLGDDQTHWLIEHYQKESMHHAIVNCNPDDLIFISDVDEIWNPNARFRYENNNFFVFKQKPYLYKLNLRSNDHWHNWTGTVLASYAMWSVNSINEARTHGWFIRSRVTHGGWHFSFQSGESAIQEKLKSYGHQEINFQESSEQIEKKIANRVDIRNRGARIYKSNFLLPKYLKKNQNKYAQMFE